MLIKEETEINDSMQSRTEQGIKLQRKEITKIKGKINELENRSSNYETKCLRNWKIKKIIKESSQLSFSEKYWKVSNTKYVKRRKILLKYNI